MHIALIGATGTIGQGILHEALQRNHHVTAISRHPEKITFAHDGLSKKMCDVQHVNELTALLVNHHAVINVFSPGQNHPDYYEVYFDGSFAIIKAAIAARVKRMIIVCNAGSFEAAPGIPWIEMPDFPEKKLASALACRKLHTTLQSEKFMQWTFICPAAIIDNGRRTGTYHADMRSLVYDENGKSFISIKDFAVAMLDEIENPNFINRGFTVGYKKSVNG